MDFDHPDYHWQLITDDGRECTTDPVYAEEDAQVARLWCESGELLVEWQRLEPEGDWAMQTNMPGAYPQEIRYPSSLRELTAASLGITIEE